METAKKVVVPAGIVLGAYYAPQLVFYSPVYYDEYDGDIAESKQIWLINIVIETNIIWYYYLI